MSIFNIEPCNILVTGAKGQLGSYLVSYFREKSFQKKSRIGKVFGIDIDTVDLSSTKAVLDFFSGSHDIDYVVHCAAVTNTSAIEKDPEKYYAANCLATKHLAGICYREGIKFIFISSDYVLSEKSDLPGIDEFPVNQYGLQKLIAELFVKEAYADRPRDYAICRSSWMFGNSSSSFVEKFLKNAAKSYAKSLHSEKQGSKAVVLVAKDAYGRPTPVDYIAQTIDSIMTNNLSGVLDVQFPWAQISRSDWAQMIWSIFTSYPKSKWDIGSDNARIVNDLVNSDIEVMPVVSSALDQTMHHPGAIDSLLQNKTVHLECYSSVTSQYIFKKWNDLAKMMVQTIKEETEDA